MADEVYSSLVPQIGDSPDVLRGKHAAAAARLIEGAAVTPTIVEHICAGSSPEQVIGVATYFRKAVVWAARANATGNAGLMRLKVGTNNNRLLSSGQSLQLDALPGQKLNLQDFTMTAVYGGDALTFELY